MSVNDSSRIVIDNSRVMLQIVAPLADDSKGIIYDCKFDSTGHCRHLVCKHLVAGL